ncbi:MAG TPA: toprim domain-containing protein [Acidimicrobiia bacterium]|nr:toprim domain-containing protein [Acidimicrobiia bacterium]
MSEDWSEVSPTPDLIRETVDIRDVAELLGLEVTHDDFIHSPYNEADDSPSCKLYGDHFHCFSTGRGGDAIDLVLAVKPELSWRQALWQIWTRALRAGMEPGDVQRKPKPEVKDFFSEFVVLAAGCEWLGPWAETLRLPEELLLRLRRHDDIKLSAGTLVIPHWRFSAEDGWTIPGVKTRAITGSKGAWTGSNFSQGLYDVDDFQHGGAKRAVICEGESDCWVLDWHWRDEDVHVFALPSGAGHWKDEWLKQLEPYSKVYICMDLDEAGKRARDKIARAVGYERAEFLYPVGGNDAREAYINGWRPTLH